MMIKLIKWIGYDTHSEQLTKITNGIFIAQFFNTGILLLLVHANFDEVGLPFVDKHLFNGPFYDYTEGWYARVGHMIVQTMCINSIMPLGIEFMPIATKWFFQRRDQSWKEDHTQRLYTTKTSQIYQYMDLYSGPEFLIHFRYSSILNITFVTMMYGLGLPILFPIAAFAYFILYLCARYQVAYTYQMPPALDDLLTKNAINLLIFSPILLLLNGFWMLSNKQFFDSSVN